MHRRYSDLLQVASDPNAPEPLAPLPSTIGRLQVIRNRILATTVDARRIPQSAQAFSDTSDVLQNDDFLHERKMVSSVLHKLRSRLAELDHEDSTEPLRRVFVHDEPEMNRRPVAVPKESEVSECRIVPRYAVNEPSAQCQKRHLSSAFYASPVVNENQHPISKSGKFTDSSAIGNELLSDDSGNSEDESLFCSNDLFPAANNEVLRSEIESVSSNDSQNENEHPHSGSRRLASTAGDSVVGKVLRSEQMDSDDENELRKAYNASRERALQIRSASTATDRLASGSVVTGPAGKVAISSIAPSPGISRAPRPPSRQRPPPEALDLDHHARTRISSSPFVEGDELFDASVRSMARENPIIRARPFTAATSDQKRIMFTSSYSKDRPLGTIRPKSALRQGRAADNPVQPAAVSSVKKEKAPVPAKKAKKPKSRLASRTKEHVSASASRAAVRSKLRETADQKIRSALEAYQKYKQHFVSSTREGQSSSIGSMRRSSPGKTLQRIREEYEKIIHREKLPNKVDKGAQRTRCGGLLSTATGHVDGGFDVADDGGDDLLTEYVRSRAKVIEDEIKQSAFYDRPESRMGNREGGDESLDDSDYALPDYTNSSDDDHEYHTFVDYSYDPEEVRHVGDAVDETFERSSDHSVEDIGINGDPRHRPQDSVYPAGSDLFDSESLDPGDSCDSEQSMNSDRVVEAQAARHERSLPLSTASPSKRDQQIQQVQQRVEAQAARHERSIPFSSTSSSADAMSQRSSLEHADISLSEQSSFRGDHADTSSRSHGNWKEQRRILENIRDRADDIVLRVQTLSHPDA
eukprot:ANDGO_00211.mRNA.1 hypothetical protein